MFLAQIGGGVLFGLVGGGLLVLAINRIKLEPGLYPIVSLSMALFIFALAGVAEGSGFLAVYVAGLVAGNAKLRGAQSLRRFHNGLTWLSQIVMFVMLGLLASPSQFPSLFLPAAALAVVLILVARPIAIWLCLAPVPLHQQRDHLHRLGRASRRRVDPAGDRPDPVRPA